MLDREIQLKILQALAAVYPATSFHVLNEIGGDYRAGIVNIAYLAEHGLVTARFHQDQSHVDLAGSPKITAKGMDFLADDGGLSAMLGTVTIKFHEESLKQLIEFRLDQAQLPTEEKNRLLQAVRELPGESIKHLTTRLLDLGMENLPRAVELIRTALP